MTQGTASLRTHAARLLWYAHPARPGPALRALEESQWWSSADLEGLQLRRLRRLVAAAHEVPFYRERFRQAGVDAASLRATADLRRVPILERSDVERLGIAGLRRPGSWGMSVSTSGSEGRPVQLLWPIGEMRWRDAGEARAHAWMGAAVGERRLEVRCRPVGRPQAISALLLNAEAIHAPSITSDAVIDALLRSARHRPPVLVWGVSNALYVVARALMDRGEAMPVRACWSGGNHLHPHYRRAFERAFQSPVYERYATMENGVIAHECVEGRTLHVSAEGIISEIVRDDGTPAAPGEQGDVVVTSLSNDATPLIRYRVGDRAIAPDPEPCVCGRGLPKFGVVAGRAADVLRTPSGGAIDARRLMETLAPAMNSTVDLQAVQDADGRVRLRLLQRDTREAEAERGVIAEMVRRLLHAVEPPSAERVETLELTPGGKLRTIVSAPFS